MNKKSNLRLSEHKSLAMACKHEAGHAVCNLHDLKRSVLTTAVSVLDWSFGMTVSHFIRPDRILMRDPEFYWRSCASYLAGLAVESSFFGPRDVRLTYPKLSWTRSSDWDVACQIASSIAKKGAGEARWRVLPWPENEMAPNGGRLLRTLCGEKKFAKLGKEKQRIIRLAWRRALWVVRRHRKAVIRLGDELLKKGALGGKRVARIFNETK